MTFTKNQCYLLDVQFGGFCLLAFPRKPQEFKWITGVPFCQFFFDYWRAG